MGNDASFIIVEGLVIFAEPVLVNLFDHLICLQARWEMSCDRRFKRGARKSQAKKPAFRRYYDDHVEQAQRDCRKLYLRNVEGAMRKDIQCIMVTPMALLVTR